jgi:poly(glycerol-phosphate) alpha-glucosyltransferase
VIHSNHALSGSDRRLPLPSSPNFVALLSGLADWDAVVTATAEQRDDIGEQYGHRDRLVAIPHYAPEPGEDLDPEDYEADRFVLVARIHRKKRVDEAIQAFRLVADKRPTARLEVFGFGYGDELEASITRLVADLGLRDNVVFRGFVEDTGSIYAGACASLQTSESEGFGMALLESLAAGVPVVAYDVAYGAREAIRDDVDGYVVPWGDREALAQRLLALAEDPGLRTRLAAAAPAGAARFSRDRYVREWTAALAALPVRESESTVTAARVVDGKLELTVDGTGALVLRPRGGGADLEAPIEDGTASFELPGLADGAILDVFLRDGEREIRARATGPAESDDPTWSVYATAYGNLSLKRLRVARIGRPAAASAPRWRRWAGTLGDRPIRWVTAVRGGR